VTIIPLAHPQKAGGEALLFASVQPCGRDRPAVVRARPGGGGDPVVVADVPAESFSVITSPMYVRISAAVAIGVPVHGLKR